jgi:hypothetical protein
MWLPRSSTRSLAAIAQGVSRVGRGDQVEDRPGRRGDVDAERAERAHPAAPAGVGCQLAGDG